MNTQYSLSIGDMASALGGAGLIKIGDDLNVGLALIGTGVVLKVLVAVLNRWGIEVSAPIDG
jgi:hypothetical protein